MFNLTNSFDHPTRPGHTVFRFYDKSRADFFEQLLVESNVWFESAIETASQKTTYLFGVKNASLKVANRNNYLVSAKFRKATIPNKTIGWLIIAIAGSSIALAIIGAIINN